MTYRNNAQTIDDLASILSDLQDFHRDIQGKIRTLDNIRQRCPQPFEASRVLKLMYPSDPRFCRTCGLPKTMDIDHDPPECPAPKQGDGKVFQAYYKHQRGLYAKALEGLSNEGLVAMGIPIGRAFINYLRDFVEKRLDDVEARHQALLDQLRKAAPNRWDLINDDAE